MSDSDLPSIVTLLLTPLLENEIDINRMLLQGIISWTHRVSFFGVGVGGGGAGTLVLWVTFVECTFDGVTILREKCKTI